MRERRREKLRERLKEKGVDAFLVSHLPNIRYLAGFTGSAGLLLVLPDETHFLTDFRYKEQSKLEVDGDIEIHIVQEPWKKLSDLLKPIKKLGFESESLTYFRYEKLKESATWVELIPIRELILWIRAIKEEEEIHLIKKAQGITDILFKELIEEFRPGLMTERELAGEMEYKMKKIGARSPAFETIVASGPHSALPHARPRDTLIPNNSILLFDFGAVFDGYSSDMTRTVWVGERPPDKFVEIYEIVKEAVERVIYSAKPGMKGFEIDAFARDFIKSRGYGENFGHGLGHGVGLEVHEKPVLSPLGDQVVEENAVFTVEPGIYIPEFGGVRIEELVVMRSTGIEVLTQSPRSLICI
jgi:Xaa-Pro aminopeptidase